jgi:toxin-antitoxin system PIN domain toxin
MSGFLLDVNVIVALLDQTHAHHARARTWFEQNAIDDWLTCPTVENGVIRVMSGTSYSSANFSPERVMFSLRALCDVGNHRFVADSARLLDQARVEASRVQTSRQVTDSYLLLIAVTHDASLATLDTRLTSDAVIDGSDHLLQIP